MKVSKINQSNFSIVENQLDVEEDYHAFFHQHVISSSLYLL